MTSPIAKRPADVLALAIILIVFGLGEIWVGFFGNYLGILAKSIPPSAATAVVGSFCFGGLMLLATRRNWGTVLSLLFIACEVMGRAYLIWLGVAPARGPDLVKIIIGGVIAVAIMLYVGCRSFALRRNRSDAAL